MPKPKIAINGLGRIGRLVFQILIDKKNVDIVVVNDIAPNDALVYLLKHDTAQGKWNKTITAKENHLFIEEEEIISTSIAESKNLPWKEYDIDIVVECSGRLRTKEKLEEHLDAGAKKVILTAPSKDDLDAMIVLGVNDDALKPEYTMVSNASCTTNCLAPMVKILDDAFGIEKGFMTTVHSYTNDQALLDQPHKDLRRARAGAINIIPTTTGAAKAVGKVLPHLNGKLDGFSLRVPTPDGSITDFVCILKKDVTKDEVNSAFKSASEGAFKNYVEYTEDPIVSTDIVGNDHSCIFDSLSTMTNGNLVKVVGWYDNEWGYSCRVVDLTTKFANM